MNQPSKVYETQQEKQIDFAIGFAAWWLGNGLMSCLFYGLTFGVATSTYDLDPNLSEAIGYAMLCLSFLPLVLNIAAMIYFAYVRRWIGLGLLGGFASALLLTVCAAVLFTVFCFVSLGQL